jgi:ABC transport system ATP-binding/permease protein
VDETRNALIVASDQYADPGLRRLQAPSSDAHALAAVLRDPEIGGFEVRTLLNEPSHTVNRAIEEFFAERQPGDLLLVHFSCHGIKNQDGELYFATPDTELGVLAATAVAAEFVNRRMTRSRSKRVVLMLDCCYAGAFERGLVTKSGPEMGIEQYFGGRGRAVITASSAREYAFEAGTLTDTHEVRPSVFTSALVEGLETGEADRDQDGLIGLDELYDYIYDRVRAVTPNQTPGKWAFGMEGELYIARRSHPVTTPASLPTELQQAIESRLTGIRLGAVHELAGILQGRHAGMALAARQALEQLAKDDSRAVATAANAALGVRAPEPLQPFRPELALSNSVVDLGHLRQHGQSPEHRVQISNVGGGSLNARAATSATWLRLRHVGDELLIAADTSRAGEYEGAITVTSDGGTGSIRVHMRVDPVPSVQPDALPSVDYRPTTRMPLPAKSMLIGRRPDNDLVLSRLDVSRHHAALRRSPRGEYEIVDLGSHNGTFVNGQRVSSQLLTEHDLVSIGNSTFRLKDGELRQFVDEGIITFSAHDLVVKARSGKMLLDRVTFPIPEKCLVGIIGPSGAGKSTLLGALTGIRSADTGAVLYDNRDLYQNYSELRYRIGLVPQESVLHTQLTARRALQYAAELRFAADTDVAERERRVNEVISELGLNAYADTPVGRLSTGQSKRADVAQELLTSPSLLCLDEPTSGLDPGLDTRVMAWLRDLAHDGRTVIVVTHSVSSLDKCDRLLVLLPGGTVAFYGPPAEGLSYFGKPGWADVFQAFERYPDRDWAAEFAASPAHLQYVIAPSSKPAREPAEQRPPPALPPPQRHSALRQMATMTRRYVRLIGSDRAYLTFIAVLPVVLGALIRFFPVKHDWAVFQLGYDAQALLATVVACACLTGTSSSIWELVKERRIYIRERTAGLSSGAYLASKLLVLGAISILQSLILVLVGLAGQPLSSGAAFAGAPLPELFLGVAALTLASMCLGLLGSSLVSTPGKAAPLLVLLTSAQIILCGGVVPITETPVVSQLAWLAPSHWGFGALAATADLNYINPPAAYRNPLWTHNLETWLRNMSFTIALAVIFTLIAWIRLRRLGADRRR